MYPITCLPAATAETVAVATVEAETVAVATVEAETVAVDY
jgi:hypothetical protein